MNNEDVYDPDHYLSRTRLSNDDVEKFHAAKTQQRDIPCLFADLILYRAYLEGKSPRITGDTFEGIRASLDDIVLKLAVMRAKDMFQLQMKIEALDVAQPFIPANVNLRALIYAGIRADLFALKPSQLPAGLPEWLVV